jgi:hypothetical protein
LDEDEPSLIAKQQARRENPSMSREELEQEARRIHRVLKAPHVKKKRKATKTYYTWPIPIWSYTTSADSSSTTASDSTSWRWG